MGAGKSIAKFFLKFFLVIVVIIAVIAAGVLIYYAVTLRSAEDFLPDKFLFYVKIDSLKEIYDNVLDLKAAEVIFSQPEFRSVYRALLEFKSTDISRDPILKKLLEMRASIVVHPDRSLSLVLEPGLLSVATRNFSLINAFLKVEDLSITTIQKADFTLYSLNLNPKDQFFFSVVDNLVFVSDKQANIEALYRNAKSGKNLRAHSSLAEVRGKLEEKGMLELYVATPTLIDIIFKDYAEVRRVLSLFTFNELSLLSFTLSNEELQVGLYSSYAPKSDAIASFLDYNAPSLQSLRYPPQNGSVYSAINVKSFKELFNLRLLLESKDIEGSLAQIEDLAQKLLGLSLDDLIWSWAGEEVGAFLTARSSEPVIFLRVRDNQKLEAALKKLDESLFLDKDSSLVFNDVRLTRINFPDLIKGIVNLFVENLEMPYFYQTDDFIFFCREPEVLADAINDYKAEKVLLRSETFRRTTEAYPKNANVFLYYDLTRSNPPFFPPDSLPGRLFKLYESGLIAVYWKGSELRIRVNARGIAGRKTVPLAGYPKPLEKGTSGDVSCVDLYGSAVGELVYVDHDHNLVIQDLLAGARSTAPLEAQSVIVPLDYGRPARADIFTFSPSGTLGRYQYQAQAVSPFPAATRFKNSFPPVEAGDDLLFYSKADASFFFYPKSGGQEKPIPFPVPNPVLARPAVSDGLIAFYPKDFEGSVYVIDREGKLLPGWSQAGGGIAYGGPDFLTGPEGQPRVLFLTQAGRLSLWDIKGQGLPRFPVQLDGTYFSSPCQFNRRSESAVRALAALSEAGLCTLLTQEGAVLKEKPIPEAAGRNSALTAFDVDRDGDDELFIYGGSNFIIALDRNLELLPGFPVKGGRKPAFADINLDGKKEMLTIGFDNQIYAYELNR